MLAKVISNTVLGIEGNMVEVEVDIAKGLPAFSMVGLPDKAVKEARERVKAAIKNSGFEFPIKKITVNLAPAGIKKEGAAFDLPIAAGILAASGQINQELLTDYLLVGELSLDGRVKAVNGALVMALASKEQDKKGVLLPNKNYYEASVINGIDVIAVKSLDDAVQFLNGGQELRGSKFMKKIDFKEEEKNFEVDYKDVRGQRSAKRALEIAAAGGHNLIMLGPPGSGKTMLARRLPTILPELSREEAIEVTKIYSVTGQLEEGQCMITKRPFRSPHHSISRAGLLGGGSIPEPGEITLAHKGILFLDEMAEFNRDVLESLRQPLEKGEITIARSKLSLNYPAQFSLIASSNLCPCGLLGSNNGNCSCSSIKIRNYQRRLSGPLLDRIDLHVSVAPLKPAELLKPTENEASASIKQRVIKAQQFQFARYKREEFNYNSEVSPAKLEKYFRLNGTTISFLEKVLKKLNLSARAYNKLLKIARTIADLSGDSQITKKHLAEAVQYRDLDRRTKNNFQ